MGLRLLIDGVERTDKVDWAPGPITINQTLYQRPTANFTCVKDYFPARFDEVLIYDHAETTLIFGGLIHRRNVVGMIDRATVSRSKVSCVGFIAYADYCYISLTYSTNVDLEDVVDAIVDTKLNQFGITYTPSATGISLAPFTWVNKRVSDALRELSDRTKRVIDVSPSKVLTITTPGSAATPSSITDGSPNCYDINWDDEGEIVPNKLILVCGAGTQATVESFLGSDGVSDGTFTNFYVIYPAVNDYNGLWPQLINLDGVPTPVIWEDYAPPSHAWTWDPVNARIRYRESFGALSPTLAITSVNYVIKYPFTLEDDTGATPVIEELLVRPDVLSMEQGLELIPNLLDQRGKLAQRVNIHTWIDTFVVGKLVTIDITARGVLDDDFLITDRKVEIRSDENWHYNFTCIPSVDSKGNFVDEWRDLIGLSAGNSGSGISIVSAPGSGGGGSGGTVSISAVWVYLGGSRNTSIAKATAAWTPVVDYIEYVPPEDFSALVRATMWARNSGVTVTVRLRNVTDSTSVSSSGSASTSPVDVGFFVALEAGKTYRLEVLSSTNEEGVYAIGSLETA